MARALNLLQELPYLQSKLHQVLVIVRAGPGSLAHSLHTGTVRARLPGLGSWLFKFADVSVSLALQWKCQQVLCHRIVKTVGDAQDQGCACHAVDTGMAVLE